MKKSAFVLVIISLMMSCFAILHAAQYDISGEFEELINENPIDAAYEQKSEKIFEEEEETPQIWKNLEEEFVKIWETEMNAVYQKLLAVLSPQERELLTLSHKGWLRYHQNEPEFLKKLFAGKRETAAQGELDILISIKDRLRTRTLELLEYYYILKKEVSFVYKK
jgi:uncharacterized protein YecT (DUF1311 family)